MLFGDHVTASDRRVAAVTVTYFSGDTIGPFADSLRRASAEQVDLVVVDNGSDDGSLDAVADRPDVQVVHSRDNLGYGGAANVGVAATETPFVIVANPDIVWDPGAIDALLAAAERWPRGAAFGPLIHTPEGVVYPSARLVPSLGRGIGHAVFGWWWPSNPWTAAYRVEKDKPVERVAGWLSGSCLLLRREAFDLVGGFDTGYFMYFEDLDLGERLANAGWQNVYVPSAVVTHAGGSSTSRNAAAMAAEHHRSAWRYLSRRYAGWRWAPVRWVLHAGLTVRSALARRVPKVAAGAEPQQHD